MNVPKIGRNNPREERPRPKPTEECQESAENDYHVEQSGFAMAYHHEDKQTPAFAIVQHSRPVTKIYTLDL